MSVTPLTVDLDRNMLCRNGIEVKVTPRTAEIISVMLERRVTDADRLLDRIYGQLDAANRRTMHVFISRGRDALAQLGCSVIHHAGHGYEILYEDAPTFSVSLPSSLRPSLQHLAAANGLTIDAIVTAEVSAALSRF